MQLWEFILPLSDNGGRSYARALSETRAVLLDCFGGYTVIEADSGWREGAIPYEAPVACFRVLCEERPSVDWLWDLFPDQKAFHLARIGEGEIISR